MFWSESAQYNQAAPGVGFWVFYTGLTINATKGSRTAISAPLPIGGCLVMDPYGHDKGVGVDYTRPQTNHLDGRKVVVADVPVIGPDGVRNPRTGPCWVWVIGAGPNVPVLVANGVAALAYVGPVDGSFVCAAKSGVASLAAIHEVLGRVNGVGNSSGADALVGVAVPAGGVC